MSPSCPLRQFHFRLHVTDMCMILCIYIRSRITKQRKRTCLSETSSVQLRWLITSCVNFPTNHVTLVLYTTGHHTHTHNGLGILKKLVYGEKILFPEDRAITWTLCPRSQGWQYWLWPKAEGLTLPSATKKCPWAERRHGGSDNLGAKILRHWFCLCRSVMPIPPCHTVSVCWVSQLSPQWHSLWGHCFG